MRFKEFIHSSNNLTEMAQVRSISPEEAKANKLFGPVYHGTSEEKRSLIAQQGFKVFYGAPRTDTVTNGYEIFDYQDNIPPPVHHLGYGIYFTTNKRRGKMYNWNTTKNLEEYYIHAPKMETINFGASNTMMKWWQKNGYNMPPLDQIQGDPEKYRIQATHNLTNNLASKYDAVWYKGKGFGELLDGDQICVFDPDNIFKIDNSLSPGYETNGINLKPGDRFQIKETKSAAKLVKTIEMNPGLALDVDKKIWENVIGPFNFYMLVDINKKAASEIYDVYGERVYQAILNLQSNEFFSTRIKHTGSKEASAKSYLDVFLNKTRLERLFPSGLVAKKLKPREKIK